MKWIEAKVFYDADPSGTASELIPLIFDEFGVQGVVIESPDIEVTDGWFDDSLTLPNSHAVTGYLPITDLIDAKLSLLKKRLLDLESDYQISTRLELSETNEEDWAESWKSFFFPEKISRFFVIKPTWRDYQPNSDDIVIEIDPGMAFGTGSHPTTRLCVQQIETYVKPGCRFLDVGTGSGILMIAALKLGAAVAVGIDKDEVAIETAQKNVIINRMNDRQFRLITGNLMDCIHERFDVIAANILTETILDLLDTAAKAMNPGGVFICSGIFDQKQDLVSDKLKQLGFEILSINELEHWVCIAGRLP